MVKGSKVITKKQITYIKEYLSGKTLKEIGEKYNKDPSSISKVIHWALGAKYNWVYLNEINYSVFKEILDKYEEQVNGSNN